MGGTDRRAGAGARRAMPNMRAARSALAGPQHPGVRELSRPASPVGAHALLSHSPLWGEVSESRRERAHDADARQRLVAVRFDSLPLASVTLGVATTGEFQHMESKFNDYASGGSGGSYDNTELRPTPNNIIEADIVRVFATNGQYGDSLGVVFENPALTYGGLYLDPEKGTFKSFSWEEMTGYTISESIENGDEPSADDAPEVLPKTYGDTKKRYHLVGAAVTEETDDDGNVIVEASSRARPFEYDEDEADVEFGEFEDLGGDPVEFGTDIIIWNDGSEDYGANATSLRLTELLTEQGDAAIGDEDDIYGWLNAPTGENLLREELEGRRVRFFIVRRQSQSNDRSYNHPVLEDVKTGEPLQRDNSGGGSGN